MMSPKRGYVERRPNPYVARFTWRSRGELTREDARYEGSLTHCDDESFDDKIKRLTAELEEQLAQSAQLEQVIRKSLQRLGYGEGEAGMSADLLNDMIKQADKLTPDEKLRLATFLVDKARAAYPIARPRRKWAELRGLLPYPAFGEDAQTYISRTRREGDERRERQIRGTS